ncbi:hypothetical protein Mal4_08090 [Maioricimonas rarisocia]|uniref:Glycosyltransferase 2-like domain-containing protein n=1 Tax=Maioricimonas rarisocia TaxID=2528026 RepID=A0A517Z213_9PLAN|nr:glycosyltransferase family 2 protein [Maioricimonas rarisocia]QDU36523.1 hypothetical protein Mal4_08090 [Maioricimonas rarisocia]
MIGFESTTVPRKPLQQALISVVLPLYNEAVVLRTLHKRVQEALEQCGCRYEILFVDDGSTDGGGEFLDQLAARTPAVRVIHFSRNFGHQAAVQAGLEHAAGDAVVIMDSDLQDLPEAIPDFVRLWTEGYDVVYAVRHGRKENGLKRMAFYGFYRMLNAVARTPMPMDAGNFGLLDRRVVQEIAALPDRDRYFPGLRSWVGFRQTGIAVERGKRHDDRPRVTLTGLFRLAKTALFAFSSFPLTMFYGIALVSMLVCGGVTGFTLYHKLVTGLAIPGWASMTMLASFFGALNALGIGILGEYAIRIYDQVRARPQYIISRRTNVPVGDSRRQQQLLNWLAENWSGDEEEIEARLDRVSALAATAAD